MLKTLSKFLIITFTLLSPILQAREPYHAQATVGIDSVTVSAPNLVDLSRDLRETALESLLPSYTPTSAISIDINLRNVFALTSFAANSTTLVVTIPQAGISTSFEGATRDESLQLFKSYIRDGGTRHQLLRAYGKYSPIDPIAGNPNSLMAVMANADYLLGKLTPLSGCNCYAIAQPVNHLFQGGSTYTRAFSTGYETTSVTLPLRYSYSSSLDWSLILDAPITYNRNGGASSILGSLGIGLRLPVSNNWSLTSIYRFGAGGSLDLCTSGTFVSAGVLSVYNYRAEKYVWSLSNYVGYFASTNLWLSGINFNYRLQNYVVKNALSLTSCEFMCFLDIPFNISLSFIDTCFTKKNRLFIDHYDEIGMSIILTGINPYLKYDYLSLGFVYGYGNQGYKSYSANLIYQF